MAQTTSAVTIELHGPDGTSVDGAHVLLENRNSGFSRQMTGGSGGVYSLANLPLQTYRALIEAKGFADQVEEIALRTNVPLLVNVSLKLAAVRDAVTVTSRATADLVNPEMTGTSATLSATAMATIPVSPGSRGLESYLATFPGFAVNANGAIHPRGAHNQMTYVIDGMPISDQLTGAFATALDPSVIENLELHTGNVPAEFGAKVSGVAAITTRSAQGSSRKFFGATRTGASSFSTFDNSSQFGGEYKRFAWVGSVSLVKTQRFLDQVALQNLHNGGNSERGFLRLDYQAGERDTLHLDVMTGRSSFELANLASQEAAGMNQRQNLRDVSVWAHWNRILTPRATWESTAAYRSGIAQLLPSPGDTPVTASQARHLTTVTLANRLNVLAGPNTLRAGADIQYFPISEYFSMGLTNAEFNVPGDPNFNDGLLPYDLTRGGRFFQFAAKSSGTLASSFVQDSLKWRRWTFLLGVRYDYYRLLVNGNQVQPRLGLAFHLKETGTVFRISYNRNYQTPPNENLLLSGSAAAAALAPASVRRTFGDTVFPMRPQRENVYEGGLQQSLWGLASLNVSLYHKDSKDQQDNNNFFNTGVIFPVTLAAIRVNGAEARLTLPPIKRVTATISATHSRAISTPPFTGGLFLGQDAVALLSAGPFVIDHDQKLSVSATAHYAIHRRWWMSGMVRYDSGLVANPSDPKVVAADPDYRDLLPYVNLNSSPARVRPHTITDMALGYQHWRKGSSGGDGPAWDLQLQANNLFDVTALHNFQSVFVGTRVVSPRSVGLKLRFYW